MLNIIQNTIGALARKGLSVIRNGLKMWLPFEKSEILGEELVVNGDFATDSDWTKTQSTGTAEIVGGEAHINATSDGNPTILQDTSCVSGRTYYYEIEQRVISGDGGVYKLGGTTIESSEESFSGYVTAISTDSSIRGGYGNREFYTSNISIKEVTQIAPDKSGNSNGAKLFTGKALSFDGVNDYVDLGNHTLDIKTFSFWVNTTINTTSKGFVCHFGTGTNDSISVGHLTSTLTNETLTISTDASYTATTDVYPASWNRVVVAWNGTKYDIYINGVKKTTINNGSDAGLVSLSNKNILLGKRPTHDDFFFEGVLSDFQIYDTAWTQADVTFDYNNPQHLVTDAPLREEILGEELVVNGDFKLNSNWLDFGTPTTSEQSTEKSYTDTKSWKIVANATRQGIQSPNNFNLTSGLQYRVSLWVYSVSGNSITSGLNNTNVSVFTSREVVVGQWTNITYKATATSTGASYVSLFSENPSTFYIDNVSVKEVTQSSSLGSELVDNGDFATDLSGWDNGGTATSVWDTGRAELSTTGTGYIKTISAITTVVGMRYKFLVTLTGTGNTANVRAGTSSLGVDLLNAGWSVTDGSHIYYFVATTTTTYIAIGNGSTSVSYIDNISVKEVTSPTLNNLKGYWHLSEGDGAISYDSSGEGNDGTIIGATWDDQQATIPQLGLMDWSKGSNLIEYSEDFSDSSWTKGINTTVTANFTVAPDGTQNASRVEMPSGSGTYTYYQFSATSSTNHTFSFYAKNNGGDADVIMAFFVASQTQNITLTNEWQRFEFTKSITSGSNVQVGIDNVTSVDMLIWGAQCEESSSATAYRRTNGTAVTDATLIANPNNPSEDILGNSVRLREHSLNLDGDSYAKVPDADNLDFGTDAFTIQFWAKPNSIANNMRMVTKGITGNGEWMISFSSSDNVRVFAKDSNGNSLDTESSSFATLSVNTWAMVSVVIDTPNDKILFYKDNQSTPTEHTGASWSGNFNSTKPIVVGDHSSFNSTKFDGLIDDVRIYDRVLSSDEVEQNYKAGLNKHKTGSSFSDDFSSDYGF